jgi:hypothetical protein
MILKPIVAPTCHTLEVCNFMPNSPDPHGVNIRFNLPIPRMAHLLATCLFALFAQSAYASVEKAKLLYDAHLLDDAKKELVATATSDASPDEKAAALHLLGTIAVDEKRYESALSTWSELLSKYPNTQDAREVQGKMKLVRELASSSSTIAEPPSPAAASRNSMGGVLVTAAAPLAEYVELTANEISNYLVGQSVDATRSVSSGASLSELIPVARQSGAQSILVLTLKFGYLESLRAECYLVDGGLQWEEKSSGSFGFTKSGVAAGLIDRMKDKLESRVGDVCLPRSK